MLKGVNCGKIYKTLVLIIRSLQFTQKTVKLYQNHEEVEDFEKLERSRVLEFQES